MIGKDELSAYMDGEAPPARAREIEAALAADPDLRARLERLRRNDLNVKAAMDSLLERPGSDRLEAAVRAAVAAHETPAPATNVVALNPRAPLARQAFWPSAIAAALVGGVLLGHFAPLGGASTADWTTGAGAPQAGKAMAAALGAAASGARVTLASGRTLSPVMTFAARDGGLCRQFRIEGPGVQEDALACRGAGETWRLVAMVAAAPPASGGGYRTAAGPGDDAVSAMAGRLMQGEPMDAAAEASALRHP